MIEPKIRGVLDTPLLRSMTASFKARLFERWEFRWNFGNSALNCRGSMDRLSALSP